MVLLQMIKKIFRWLVKIVAVLLVILLVSFGVIYAYLSIQTGASVSIRPFFQNINQRPLVIAHRGGAGIFPENTLLAFQESWKLGVDVLEMDIRETADEKIVAMHDRTVNRTTDGEGNISEMTLAEVKKLNAGYKFTNDGGQTFPFREQKITVPILEEIFDALPDARFNIEIKNESPTVVNSLCKLIRERKLTEKVIVASISQTNLDNFRRECSEVATSASFTEVLQFYVYYKSGLTDNYTPKMSSLQTLEKLFGMQVVSKESLEIAHQLNLQIHVWTVNQPEQMQRLIEIGVDGIMTDYPDRLLEKVGRSAEKRN